LQLFLGTGVILEGCISAWCAARAALILAESDPTRYRIVLAEPVRVEVEAAIGAIPNPDARAAVACGVLSVRLLSPLMPLCRPALITVAIFSFINSWNDFIEPSIYLHDEKLRTLALGLRGVQELYPIPWTLMMAASAVIVAPVLVLFFAAQRNFIRGIQLTGLAGR
jgi:ABC-type spermidine/putrescine transport system permease subunit II